MNQDEFRDKLLEINSEIENIMHDHELINNFDHTLYSIHPCFIDLSDLLIDYIINVNDKFTTLAMASFFEEQFPEIIKSDPFIFADPNLDSCSDTVFGQILFNSYDRIIKLNQPYQKQYSIYRYINICDNIENEIKDVEGKSIGLIKETIQQLSLQPIEIDVYC